MTPASPTPTRTPGGPTDTPTNTPIPDNTLYSFEDGTVMGWVRTGSITSIANSTAMAYYGTHSLALQCVVAAGGNGGDAGSNTPLITNLTGKLMYARVFVPPGFPSDGGGAIEIHSGPAGAYERGPWVNFVPGGWNIMTYDPTHGENIAPGSITDSANVKFIGFQLYINSSAWTGTLNVDSVEVVNAPPAATATSNPPPTITPTPNSGYPSDPYIQYYGRWDKSDPTNYRANWGNVYITAKFTGTSIGIKMWDECYLNNYQYSIDGGAFTQLLANTSTAYALASGLPATTHTVIFMRRTDCQAATGSDIDAVTDFWGFTAADGSPATLVAPDPAPSRKMEFIGDSISVGTGDENTTSSSTNTNSRYN
jgi:hypothetical protein